ncbi:uncharacterized protein At1g66480-like [Telopea speciosissima]|uniref:uncharacterized protein At1g66480-like n=1 Tax=Telopea speciosissima TaxID=54955 RepID=UPI001CC3E4E9|nr:uncharacterized protein At1g66480-like [Telopea speciosissima]
MGNTVVAGRRITKVMNIDGKTFELKTPLRAGDVTKDYPGHVLIESEAVKNFGIRAEPLEPQQELKPKRIYFLVEIPKFPHEEKKKNSLHRKVQPGVQINAKEKIESLMLSRRSTSDLSFVKERNLVHDAGMVRVKVRVPKSEVAKLMDESHDATEAAEKIMDLCINKSGLAAAADNYDDDDDDDMYTKSGPLLGFGYNTHGEDDSSYSKSGPLPQQSQWRPNLDRISEGSNRPRRRAKKVSFLAVKDEELE